MFQSLKTTFIKWVTYEPPAKGFPLCDFERICYELKPCDVLLIEGRSRASNVIRLVTQSSWSHACLYIGRLYDIEDLELRKKLIKHFDGSPNTQLVIEGYMGQGTIVSPLENYKHEHLRICRPQRLSRQDAQKVTAYAISQLGTDYDTRQLFDLARFLVPWSIMPGRWRSTLFAKNAGESTKTVCSTMIAEAFTSVEFPILPVIKQHEETGIELIHRNPKLFTPRDFDYSPFFDIIKYPFIELSSTPPYRNLPWNRSGLISPDGLNVINENLKQGENPEGTVEVKETEVDAALQPEKKVEDNKKKYDGIQLSLNFNSQKNIFTRILFDTQCKLSEAVKITFRRTD